MSVVTRFAPSPTGPLHLGHAYAAIVAHDMARRHGGTFLLRIEDIDRSRYRAEWEQRIFDDLRWLGLEWSAPVLRQSDRLATYRSALDSLGDMGLTYACRCNRRDIAEAARAPQEGAPLLGPDGLVYPGTCKHEDHPPDDAAIRLHIDRAVELTGPVAVRETGFDGRTEWEPERIVRTIGDIVLARRDMGTSYHLSVVIDDAAQGVTHVTRGRDLFDATPIHIVLQRLLRLPTPTYHHHDLVRDAAGKRLAKRDDARSIESYREAGHTPADLRAELGL